MLAYVGRQLDSRALWRADGCNLGEMNMRGWMGMAAVAAGVALASSPAAAAIIYQGSGVTVDTGWLPSVGLTAVPGVTYYIELKTPGPVLLADYMLATNYEYFYYREDGSFDFADNNPSVGSGRLNYANGVYSAYVGPYGDFDTYWDNGNLKKHVHYTAWFALDVDLGLGVEYSYLIESVPEPSSWALMIVGFGLAGAALRRRSPARSVARAEACS